MALLGNPEAVSSRNWYRADIASSRSFVTPRAHVEAFNVLRTSPIDWTYLAPAVYFEPGERTGKFCLGKDELVANAQQESRISMEDYAIALVDELEEPRHSRQRFSVGY